MPSVRELSALYENVMLGPRRGPDVCATCFNFTAGYVRCYACAHGRPVLDAMAPISYSVAREHLHHALASYKRRFLGCASCWTRKPRLYWPRISIAKKR
jgi:hypothetical protein